MVDDAHDLAQALELGPVVAVGSSMGGAICQRWALRHPEDIGRLVLTITWAERDAFTNALFDHWISLAKAGGEHIIESLPTGHMVFWEMPEAFKDLVQTFLRAP
jgi:pimeloyl-ACP methyl ester carboxylesterase